MVLQFAWNGVLRANSIDLHVVHIVVCVIIVLRYVLNVFWVIIFFKFNSFFIFSDIWSSLPMGKQLYWQEEL